MFLVLWNTSSQKYIAILELNPVIREELIENLKLQDNLGKVITKKAHYS